MSKNPIERFGGIAVRQAPEAGPDGAERLAALSRTLSANGVMTPIQHTVRSFAPGETEAQLSVRMAWIDGIRGPDTLMLLGDCVGERETTRDILRPVLEPLMRLHAIERLDLQIEPFDFRAKIAPRIERFRAAGVSDIEQIASIHDELSALSFSIAARRAGPVIHGDFHIGQVVIEYTTGTSWLLDLEDVSRGPVEADVANFAAHLATSPALRFAPLGFTYPWWRDVVQSVYAELTGWPVDGKAMGFFGAASLLRRGLKLREKDVAEFPLGEVAATARDALGLP